MMRRFPFVLLVLFSCALWASPGLADRVPVSGTDHGDYGRFEFSWPGAVGYSAVLQGDRVIVTFDRPIETDFSQALGALRKYARNAVVNPDGRSITILLTAAWGLDYFDMGRAVIVDLLDEGNATPFAAAEPAPTQQSRAAAPLPQTTPQRPFLGVRFGEHPSYSRMVFDWPLATGYEVVAEDEAATLLFNRNAEIDLSALRSSLPKNIRSVEAFSEAGGLTVVLGIPKGSELKHFLSGPKVVVDVANPASQAPSQAATAPESAPASPAKTDQSAPPQPAKVAKVQTAKPEMSPVSADAPAPKANKPVSLVPPTEQKMAGLPSAKPPTLTAGLPPGVIPSSARPNKAPIAPAAIPTPTPTAKPPARPQGMSPSMESAQVAPKDALFSIQFNWDEPVGAAIFRRGDSLWAVFDKKRAQDLEAVRQAAGDQIPVVEQLESLSATLIRMETAPGLNPSLRRNGLTWILDFKQQNLEPRKAIEAVGETVGEVGRRLFIPIQQAGKAVPLRDPKAGDNLVVVPIIPLGHGVGLEREYAEFFLLPTGQGVVMRPKVDNIRVRPFPQGVELTSDTGLKVTPAGKKEGAASTMVAAGLVKRIFEPDTWLLGDRKKFQQFKQEIQYEIATTKAVKRRAARMKLAKFYIAQKMGHEAEAVLNMIAAEDEAMQSRPEFRAMRGAARFLKSRFKEAIEDLSHGSLEGIHEAEFWKAAAQASLGQIKVAAEEMRRTGTVLRKYPRNLKFPLGALAAETAITVGDVEQAQHFIDMLALDDPSPQEEGQLAYLEGRIAELSGDFDKAVERWEAATEGAHRPSRAKASYARAELLRRTEEFTAEDAIEALEKLRFSWRGDNFEFTLLRKLGGLYFQKDDFRNGLQTLRQAATYFRNHPQAPMVTQEMARAFRHLYLEGGGDTLSPVTAIALFDEFKELTPAGDTGDLMIRRLADRLIGVDLLDRAAKLLENQVHFRLKGEERAKVGAKLALIYMQNRKLEQALKSLDQTVVAGIPEELVALRRHLRARALMELGRTEQVILTLEKDESMEADIIRSELYWRKRDWPKAAQSLRRVVRGVNARPNETLDNKQAKYVMNLAVALTLGANERGINRLRSSYGEAMATSPYGDAFRLITSSGGRGLIDYRTISQKVREVESFQAFMSAYKERLKAAEEGSSG